MAKYVLPLSLVLVVFVAGCTGNDADDAMATAAEVSSARLVGVDEFAERMGEPDVLAVNVHVPDEGQLPGTDLAIRFDEISDSEALPPDLDTPLAIYCKSGNMSAEAVADLVALGYTDVVELDGGFDAWVEAGRRLDS
ncbi:MAG TPA: rhodanese-like domain-containing protein [Microthrixaceae bacterium]|jgi:rhodanese-related sulfurtransferase|nr:rhodanese-like domain-containing protein [Microthrixaceae bacterium]